FAAVRIPLALSPVPWSRYEQGGIAGSPAASDQTASHECKRVVDAIFDPEDGVISKQIKRGGKVTIAGFGTFDRRNHKARDVNSVFTGKTVKVKARKIPGFRAGVSFKEAMR